MFHPGVPCRLINLPQPPNSSRDSFINKSSSRNTGGQAETILHACNSSHRYHGRLMNEVRMYNHKQVVKVELYNMIKMEF